MGDHIVKEAKPTLQRERSKGKFRGRVCWEWWRKKRPRQKRKGGIKLRGGELRKQKRRETEKNPGTSQKSRAGRVSSPSG